ncbi:hypothetical protein A3B63_02120 [Candidatus Saccharibacteria bacterium RIFCSPLOWO2_01_FULL_49_22]|nr:MAG: hypothetical protein A3B63_02120 [Candidatus Saccharibacteria bacterium RIFCSPLOWO2_01_FULL_49_22]
MLLNRRKNSKSNAGRQGTSAAGRFYRAGNSNSSRVSPFGNKQAAQSRSRRWLARLTDITIVIAVLAVAVYSLMVSSPPDIRVVNNFYNTKEVYSKAVIEQFDKIKNSNKITFNEKEMESQLRKQFPEISKVIVDLPLVGQRPKVTIEIDEPALRLAGGSGEYVINKAGVVAAKSDGLAAASSLVLVRDESGFDLQAGSPALDKQAVIFIEALTAQLKKAKVPIESLTFPPRAQELNLKTADQPYYVKFYLGGDAASQIGQFLAARQQLTSEGIQPHEYLDVRVAGKVFYK